MAYQDQRSRHQLAIPGPALIGGNTPGRQISPNNSYNSLASLGIYPAFATYSQGYNQFVPSPLNYSRTFSDDTRQPAAQIPRYVYVSPTQEAPTVHSFDNSSKRNKSNFSLELLNNSTSHRQGHFGGISRVEDYYDGSYLTSRNPRSSQFDNCQWQPPVSSPRYAPSSPSIRQASQYDAVTVSKSRMLPCRTFISTGCCPYGARCVFLHDPRIACSTAWRVDKVLKCILYSQIIYLRFVLATEA